MTPRERAIEALTDAHAAALDWANTGGEDAALAREVAAATGAALTKAVSR